MEQKVYLTSLILKGELGVLPIGVFSTEQLANEAGDKALLQRDEVQNSELIVYDGEDFEEVFNIFTENIDLAEKVIGVSVNTLILEGDVKSD